MRKILKMIANHPLLSIVMSLMAIIGAVTSVLQFVEREYEMFQNGVECGFTSRTVSTQTHEWKSCPNTAKVVGYEFSETVTKSSGWVGGGHDQNWHCTNVKREKEKAIGLSIVWGPNRASEEDKKDFLGHVEYKYHCAIEAKWGPVYQVERHAGCGPAEPVIETVKEADWCPDKTKPIGWRWKL